MHSAFGVEHGYPGEISKGRLFRLKGKPGFGKRPTANQVATQAPSNTPTRTAKAKGAVNRVLEAPISIKGIGEGSGAGVGNVGGWMKAHPGVTGTALVGGGGAAGYKYLSQKEPRKRKKAAE